MTDGNVGEQYGIYVIDSVSEEKNKSGSTLYNGVCVECGFVAKKTIGDFKRKNVQTCTHYNKLTQEQKDAWYEKHKKQCLYCGRDIPIGNKFPSDYKKIECCNHKCAALYLNNKHGYGGETNCLNCGKEIPYKNKYCSSKCQQDYQHKTYINRWKQGDENGVRGEYSLSKHIKRYLFDKYDSKCYKCGWGEVNQFTGNIPLEVHHKDGDYSNNSEDNLELLCPNCHSLTDTYKAGNMGNGRKDRSKYS